MSESAAPSRVACTSGVQSLIAGEMKSAPSSMLPPRRPRSHSTSIVICSRVFPLAVEVQGASGVQVLTSVPSTHR